MTGEFTRLVSLSYQHSIRRGVPHNIAVGWAVTNAMCILGCGPLLLLLFILSDGSPWFLLLMPFFSALCVSDITGWYDSLALDALDRFNTTLANNPVYQARTDMPQNIAEYLTQEITRVEKLRQQYEETARLIPSANIKPALFLMDQALEKARKAAGSNEALDVVQAIKLLETFTA